MVMSGNDSYPFHADTTVQNTMVPPLSYKESLHICDSASPGREQRVQDAFSDSVSNPQHKTVLPGVGEMEQWLRAAPAKDAPAKHPCWMAHDYLF